MMMLKNLKCLRIDSLVVGLWINLGSSKIVDPLLFMKHVACYKKSVTSKIVIFGGIWGLSNDKVCNLETNGYDKWVNEHRVFVFSFDMINDIKLRKYFFIYRE